MERAAIDRIDEGVAVLLVGEEERELYVPLEKLPPGVQAGDWLRLSLVQGQVEGVEIDREETRRRRERLRSMLDRLFE